MLKLYRGILDEASALFVILLEHFPRSLKPRGIVILILHSTANVLLDNELKIIYCQLILIDFPCARPINSYCLNQSAVFFVYEGVAKR